MISKGLCLAVLVAFTLSAGGADSSDINVEQPITIDTQEALQLYNQAEQMRASGNFQQAEQAYSQFLAIQPNEPVAILNLAFVMQKQGKFSQALQQLEPLKRSAAHIASLWMNLGYCYYSIGQTQKSVQHYKKFLQMAPNNADASRIAGNIVSQAEIGHCIRRYAPTRQLSRAEITLLTVPTYEGSAITVTDIHRAALHEIGHALGTDGHSKNAQDIMYLGAVTTQNAPALSERDSKTLWRLYGVK